MRPVAASLTSPHHSGKWALAPAIGHKGKRRAVVGAGRVFGSRNLIPGRFIYWPETGIAPWTAEARIPRHHDVVASGQWTAQRQEGLAAHHHRLASRERLEALQVGLEPPGNRIFGGAPALFGN